MTGRIDLATFEKVGHQDPIDSRALRLLQGESIDAADLETGPLWFPLVKTTTPLPRNVGLSPPIAYIVDVRAAPSETEKDVAAPSETEEDGYRPTLTDIKGAFGVPHAERCDDCGALFEAAHARTYMPACRCDPCAAVANARAHPASRVTRQSYVRQMLLPCPGCIVGLAGRGGTLKTVVAGGRKHVCDDTCQKRVLRFAEKGWRFEHEQGLARLADLLIVIPPGESEPFAAIALTSESAAWLKHRGLHGYGPSSRPARNEPPPGTLLRSPLRWPRTDSRGLNPPN